MAKALLIAGNGLEMLQEVERMRNFLVSEAEVYEVAIVQTAYLSCQKLQEEIVAALERARGEPLLLLFCGHGSREGKRKGKKAGWGLSDGIIFSYYELACILRDHPGPVFIVNSCCYAFGIVRELKRAGVSPKRVGVIASSAANRYSFVGALLPELVASWQVPTKLMGFSVTTEEKVQMVKLTRTREIIEDFFLKCAIDFTYWIHPELFKWIFKGPVTLHEDSSAWVTSKKVREETPEKRWGAELDFHFFRVRPHCDTICVPGFEAARK